MSSHHEGDFGGGSPRSRRRCRRAAFGTGQEHQGRSGRLVHRQLPARVSCRVAHGQGRPVMIPRQPLEWAGTGCGRRRGDRGTGRQRPDDDRRRPRPAVARPSREACGAVAPRSPANEHVSTKPPRARMGWPEVPVGRGVASRRSTGGPPVSAASGRPARKAGATACAFPGSRRRRRGVPSRDTGARCRCRSR